MTLKRFLRVVLYTFSMYVVTHILVFLLLPFGILMAAIVPRSIPGLKQRFTELLFRIVGKRLSVSGLDHIEEGQLYLIISNYPSFYAGFALMNIFPDAAVVAHAFIRKIPLLGLFMSRIGTIFVTPSKGKDSTRAIDKIIIHPPLRNAQTREMNDKELLETAANIIQSAYVA